MIKCAPVPAICVDAAYEIIWHSSVAAGHDTVDAPCYGPSLRLLNSALRCSKNRRPENDFEVCGKVWQSREALASGRCVAPIAITVVQPVSR